MNTIRSAPPVLVLTLLLAACGAHEERPDVPSMDEILEQMTGQDGRACIRSRNIQDFSVLEDQVVSVGALGRKHYLITTVSSCWSLRSTPQLAFSGTIGDVCGATTNTLITRDESCPIRHIYAFVSEADAEATYEMAKARREVRAQFPSGEDEP